MGILLRQIRAVLWSLFGVRRAKDSARDLEGSRPGTLIAVAVVVVALLALGLVVLARLIANDSAAKRAAVAGVPKSSSTMVVAPRAGTALERAVIPDTLAERMRACVACHGDATQRTTDGYSPRIAGKPAGYLFNQLTAFRDGRRTYAPMVYLVQHMSDTYLREIAAYFAELQVPNAPPGRVEATPALLARGRAIVETGDAARDVPACRDCHGASLSGVNPAIPALLGLPRDYINAQLGAWRSGKMRSREPDCMGEVARRLAPDEVPAVSAWLASRAVPERFAPADRLAHPLPLACGDGGGATTPVTPAGVARGHYLATAGDCIACHTARGGASYAGGRAIETPFGVVRSTNITPDVATGIGGWSRGDFWRALHNGRSKDGHLLYPAFPYPNFTQVTRADADAIFAFLRTVPAVAQKNAPHQLRFPYDTQAALAIWRALFFRPGSFEQDTARGAQWNRGAYLARGLGHCDACHANRNIFGAVSRQFDLGGGLIPMQNWYAPPLAPAGGAGVADWESAHIVALLQTGVSPRGSAMGPMAEVVYQSTQYLSAADLRAIAIYIKSLPAGTSARERGREGSRPAPGVIARGAKIYADHCVACHGKDGAGAPPAYPALAGNRAVTATPAADAIHAVINGGYPPVTVGNPRPYGMPPSFQSLGESDIAAVLSYIRASWGNDASAITTFDVQRYR